MILKNDSDILKLSLQVAKEVSPPDLTTSVLDDIRQRIEQVDDSRQLNISSEALILGGIIIQICAISVQIASILVQVRATSKQAASDKLLEEVIAQTGDPSIKDNESIRKVIDVAVIKVERNEEEE